MKIKATQETEVYISQSGYLTIRQEPSDSHYEEAQLVLLSPEQADLVIREMTRLLSHKEAWWNPAQTDEEAA